MAGPFETADAVAKIGQATLNATGLTAPRDQSLPNQSGMFLMSATGLSYLGVPGVRIFQPASPTASITEITIDPVNGGMVPIYDVASGTMAPRYLNQSRSWTVSGRTANAIHDVYAVASGSTGVEIAISSTPWASNTAGPAVGVVQGYRANTASFTDLRTGATIAASAGLYLGSVRFTAGGTTTMTYTKAFIWNQYNRRPWPVRAVEATTHSYTSTTVREWNGGAGTPPRIEWLTGEANWELELSLAGQGTGQAVFGLSHDQVAGISYDPYFYAGTETAVPYRGYGPHCINTGVGFHWTSIVEQSAGAGAAATFNVAWQYGKIMM